MNQLKNIPNKHKYFLTKAVDILKTDKRIPGIAGQRRRS